MSTIHSIGRDRIAVIVNPIAGQFRRHPELRKQLERSLAGRGAIHVPSGLEGLARCCTQILDAKPDCLVIAGGDGTLMRVLTELRGMGGANSLPIAVLPYGTVNTTAHNWIGRCEPRSVLARLLVGQGSFEAHSCLDVRIDGVPHVAATLGTGLVSHFFEEYERRGSRGIPSAAGIFCRVLVGSFLRDPFAGRILAPIAASLRVDGAAAPISRFTLLVSSVLRNVGMGLRPNYRAGTAPGKLHLVATDLEAHRLGPQAWRVFLGKPLRAPNLVDSMVAEFTLGFHEPRSVILDGDPVTAHEVCVNVGREWLVFSPR